MAFKLAELYAEIKCDSSKLVSALGISKKSLHELQGKLETMSGYSKVALAGLAGFVGGTAKIFSEQEQADAKLEAALRNVNANVTLYSSSLKKLAGDLQVVTQYSDDGIQAAMAYGLQIGVSADKIEEYTKGAIGLASVIGVDLQQGMKLWSAAMNGNTSMLSRMIPSLRSLSTEQERMAKIREIAARGLASEKAGTETATGKLAIQKKELGELAEVWGSIFLPKIVEVGRAITDQLASWTQWADANKTLVASLTAMSGGLLVMGIALPKVTSFTASLIANFKGLVDVLKWVATASFAANVALLGITAVLTALAASYYIVTTAELEFQNAQKQMNEESKNYLGLINQINTALKNQAKTKQEALMQSSSTIESIEKEIQALNEKNNAIATGQDPRYKHKWYEDTIFYSGGAKEKDKWADVEMKQNSLRRNYLIDQLLKLREINKENEKGAAIEAKRNKDLQEQATLKAAKKDFKESYTNTYGTETEKGNLQADKEYETLKEKLAAMKLSREEYDAELARLDEQRIQKKADLLQKEVDQEAQKNEGFKSAYQSVTDELLGLTKSSFERERSELDRDYKEKLKLFEGHEKEKAALDEWYKAKKADISKKEAEDAKGNQPLFEGLAAMDRRMQEQIMSDFDKKNPQLDEQKKGVAEQQKTNEKLDQLINNTKPGMGNATSIGNTNGGLAIV